MNFEKVTIVLCSRRGLVVLHAKRFVDPHLVRNHTNDPPQALFHNYLDERKVTIFDGGAEILMGRLTNAANAIGEALDAALELLAEKVRG